MIRRLIWRSRFWAMVYSAYIAFCLLPLGWVAWTTGIFGLLLVPVLLFLGFLLFALSITAAWPQFVTISQKVMTFGPLWDAVARIDSELSDHSQTIVFGPEPRMKWWWSGIRRVAVSRHWAVTLHTAVPAVVFLPDVVWLYKQLSAQRGVFSTSIQTGVLCHLRHGGFVWLQTQTESDADRVVKAIVARRPELMTGFRMEWNDLAKTSPTAMIEEIERRRTAIERLSDDEREQWIDDRLTELHDFVRRSDTAAQIGTLVGKPAEKSAVSSHL